MKLPDSLARVAVCSWSLQPVDCAELIVKLKATGIARVQLALDPLRERMPGWTDAARELRAAGIEVVSGMFGCVGEDYSTLDSIRRTGGIAPDATWAENLKRVEATAALAAELQLKLVTFHAGFLPHEPGDPRFGVMQQRLATLAELFAVKGIVLGLETGQETAEALSSFLISLRTESIGVNFDPANMLLYDKGDPVEALRVLSPWIRQLHIKDAKRTRTPGTWGQEVLVGTGEVNWTEFLSAVRSTGFSGDLVIEREAGTQRLADVRIAKNFIERLLTSPT